MIERNVDYLTMSMRYPELSHREHSHEIIQPIPFYKRGYRDENNICYYYGNPKTQKALLVLSGNALSVLRSPTNSDADIVEFFLSRGATCSRLDLAITDYIEEDFCSVDDVKQWVREGLVKSTLLGSGNMSLSKMNGEGKDELQTFYVGSLEKRGKSGIFRAYDKGVQSGLGVEIITRLELEIRSTKAHNTAKRLAQTGDIAGNFRTSFDCSSSQFERIMEAPAVVPVRGKNMQKRDEIEERNKRWLWLINQVAPSIKMAMRQDKELELGDEMLTRFLRTSGLASVMRDEVTKLKNEMYRVQLTNTE